MRASRLSLVFVAVAVLAGPAAASAALSPAPGLGPRRVVEIQLDALQHNNEPHKDAGIEQAWTFAHPDNRRITGPLAHFKAMIKSPRYRMLLDHRRHVIHPIIVTDTYALFAVTIIPASGPVVFYKWRLEKVLSGRFAGDWMTIAVSLPIHSGDSV